MAKTTEVKAKLKVEDEGSSTLDRIKKAFLGAGDAADDAGDKASSFAEQIAAVAIGEKISELSTKVWELGKSFGEAAIEGQKGDKALAGLIATAQGSEWAGALNAARELGDVLDEIGLKANQNKDDVGAAFETMVAIAGATEEGIQKATKETESLATIANVLGKNTSDLVQEFAFMGEGVVKTKGQLFQLLRGTGIFGKNTKEAAGYWAKLSDESRMQQLAYGLEQVSAQLGKSEPMIGDYLTTIDNLFGMAKEKLGEPIVESMKPALIDLIAKLKSAMPQIEKFGVMIGKEMGKWVEEAVKQFEQGFKYIETHSEEIKNAIAEGYKTAKKVVEFILEHKEEIAIAFGAKTALPALQAGASVAGSLIDVSAKGIGFLAGGGLAGAAPLIVFAAAVGAFALAVDQWQDLSGRRDKAQNYSAYKEHFEKLSATPNMGAMGKDELKNFDRQREAFVKLAEELGENQRAAGELADRAWAAHRAVRDMVGPVEQAQKMFENFAKARSEGIIPDEQSIATADALIGQVGASFTKALSTQNAGAAQYIANLLGKSEALQGAFLASADLTSEGFEALASMVESQSKEFAELLRGRASEGKTKAATPAAPKIVMTGGQTFNVKQDFRDQDPDRVAIMFEKGIGQGIERKLSAGTSIFGTN
ncbi:MAG: hypothetical protein E6Q97_12140 [Desulfurellales bacterium]|nr:MAG: hypothetical protein E6Q97_12140 [Desulfurellales bacterium]